MTTAIQEFPLDEDATACRNTLETSHSARAAAGSKPALRPSGRYRRANPRDGGRRVLAELTYDDGEYQCRYAALIEESPDGLRAVVYDVERGAVKAVFDRMVHEGESTGEAMYCQDDGDTRRVLRICWDEGLAYDGGFRRRSKPRPGTARSTAETNHHPCACADIPDDLLHGSVADRRDLAATLVPVAEPSPWGARWYHCVVCGTIWQQDHCPAMHANVEMLSRTTLDAAGKPVPVHYDLARDGTRRI